MGFTRFLGVTKDMITIDWVWVLRKIICKVWSECKLWMKKHGTRPQRIWNTNDERRQNPMRFDLDGGLNYELYIGDSMVQPINNKHNTFAGLTCSPTEFIFSSWMHQKKKNNFSELVEKDLSPYILQIPLICNVFAYFAAIKLNAK